MSASTRIVWKGIGASVRGASHIRDGSLCQDAIDILPSNNSGAPRLIAAVADGHGSPKCFRSNIGAKLAVEVARRALTFFGNHADDQCAACADETEALRALSLDAQQKMPAYLENSWKQKVDEHVKAHPFSEVEHVLLAKSKETHYLAYGTTLVALLATSRLLLHLQIGDGDTLVLEEDQQVTHPLPEDPLLEGNQTTSLCLPNSQQHIRIVLRSLHAAVPRLIMLSTDGYANSYEDNEFPARAREYHNLVAQFGAETIQAKLPGWLSDVSDQGSGDDISLALVFPSKTVLPPPIIARRDVDQSGAETRTNEPARREAQPQHPDVGKEDGKGRLFLWVCLILGGSILASVATAGWALGPPPWKSLFGNPIHWILHRPQPPAPEVAPIVAPSLGPPVVRPVELPPPTDARPPVSQPPAPPSVDAPVPMPIIEADPRKHAEAPRTTERAGFQQQHLPSHTAKIIKKPTGPAAQRSSLFAKKKFRSEQATLTASTEQKGYFV